MPAAKQRQTRIASCRIWRVREGERMSADDQVTVEEPLEIRVEEEPVAVVLGRERAAWLRRSRTYRTMTVIADFIFPR